MKKIVVIDDEKDIGRLIKSLLESLGPYEVFVAYSGAMGMAQCLTEKPDLIFLDYIMPQEKGSTMIKLFRRNTLTQHTPIIVMSGLGEAITFEKQELWSWFTAYLAALPPDQELDAVKVPEDVADRLGVQVYLPKPFDRECIRKALSYVFVPEGPGVAVKNKDILYP